VAFPEYVVNQGAMHEVPVQCNDGVYPRRALVAESGGCYEIGRQLRQAIYGEVRHGMRLEFDAEHRFYRRVQNGHVAIKIMRKARIAERQGRTQENPLNEIAAMQFISEPTGHAHVLRQIECVGDADNLYSIMPYCDGGELFDYVAESGALSEDVARQLFTQFLSGLDYLQQMGICHRDLSLENILISGGNHCVIIDLGMCLRLPRGEDGSYMLVRPQGTCGKRNYISPEIVANTQPFHGFAVDMWATGVILFIMLTGVPPVDVASELDPRFRMLVNGQLPELLRQWEFNLSPAAVDLLSQLLTPDWRLRPTIEQVVQHPWVTPQRPAAPHR